MQKGHELSHTMLNSTNKWISSLKKELIMAKVSSEKDEKNERQVI